MKHRLQVVATALLFLYLGLSYVFGRPHITKTTSSRKSSMKRGLRGQNFEVTRFKKLLRVTSGSVLQVAVDKTSITDHLERIKRQVTSHPCYKPGTYVIIVMPNGEFIHSIKCKSSTLLACWNAINSHSITKCKESRKVVYAGEVLTQECSCAS